MAIMTPRSEFTRGFPESYILAWRFPYVMGVAANGWFILWKTIYKWMMNRGSPMT